MQLVVKGKKSQIVKSEDSSKNGDEERKLKLEAVHAYLNGKDLMGKHDEIMVMTNCIVLKKVICGEIQWDRVALLDTERLMREVDKYIDSYQETFESLAKIDEAKHKAWLNRQRKDYQGHSGSNFARIKNKLTSKLETKRNLTQVDCQVSKEERC